MFPKISLIDLKQSKFSYDLNIYLTTQLKAIITYKFNNFYSQSNCQKVKKKNERELKTTQILNNRILVNI